jgi:hypothetical protein
MNELFGKITSKDIRNILAVIIVVGSYILFYFLVVKEVPAANKDLLNIVAGMLFGGPLAGVVGYYFGSSKNEADKAKKDGEQ